MTTGLTEIQAQCLRVIEAQIAATQQSPSVVEIAIAMGYGAKSKGWVSKLLDALEQRGYITRIRGRARSIRLAPHSVTCPHCHREFSALHFAIPPPHAAEGAHAGDSCG